MKDDSFVERILYGLVKKHVSGTTMSSALEKAKELNSKNMHVSITFLSNSVANRQKTKYITTTYLELVRQISRLGLKASIQAPLNQLGLDIDEATASENLAEIIKAGNKYGVFVWAEVPLGNAFLDNRFDDSKGFGMAVQAIDMARVAKSHKGVKSFKAIFDNIETDKAKEMALEKRFVNICDSSSNTVMLSPPDSLIKRILSGGKSGKTVIFEFRFGDSSKKIKKLAKRGARTSIYLPFGKDWQAYAMNNVPEKYMRFLAGKLLDNAGEKSIV